MDLLKEIELGEGKTLEFKEKLPKNKSIAKSIIAFSNTSGGKLIIGINDDRKVVGIEDDIFLIQDKVASIVYERCYPNIVPDIYSKNIDGKIVLVIEVFRGNLVPYYLKSKGKNNGTYIRVAGTNRVASFDNILELERQRRNISFDEEIDYEFEYKDLDLKPLYDEFEKMNQELTEEKMLNLKLIKKENSIIYPTKGLIIILGLYEHVTLNCSRFKGMDRRIFLDKREFSTDLFSQLRDGEEFIKKHINLRGDIEGLQRIDSYEIPFVAIREALVNALVHRDYSNEKRDIKLGVYDDRLEFISPGGLPSGLTNELIDSGRSEVRNRVIARVFKRLNYIEQWGSGINRIKISCVESNLEKPFIEESGDSVGVMIFREQKSTVKVLEKTKSTGKYQGIVVTQEDKVINELKSTGKINRLRVEELLGVGDSRARKLLAKMVKDNLIEKKGNGRSTHFVLKEERDEN